MASTMILHPGVVTTLKRLVGDELDLARLMAAGEVSSPQRLGTLTLFAVRVTGTGLAYRQGLAEHVWRNPANYLNDDFLARCNGLPILWEHPESSTMQGDDFAERAIGTVFLPYISGDEVWAIARIYDERASKMMEQGRLSTSPAVVFRESASNDRLQSEDGRSLLFEGKPSLLDHLAVCERGVWDKGGDPTGVRSDSEKVKAMTDEIDDKGQDGDKMDKVLEHLAGLTGGMKAMSARLDALESKKADEGKKEDEGEATVPKERPSEMADSRARADAEHVECIKAQAKADTIFNVHGKRASMPQVGESPLNYRVRMAGELRRFSPAHDGIDLAAIANSDAKGFGVIEDRIYADALKEGERPTLFHDDSIRMRERRNPDTGGPVREFFGPRTFVSHMSPMPRPVMSINRDAA